jgi:hypothetical protein
VHWLNTGAALLNEPPCLKSGALFVIGAISSGQCKVMTGPLLCTCAGLVGENWQHEIKLGCVWAGLQPGTPMSEVRLIVERLSESCLPRL